jgi:lipoprotein
MKKVLFLFVLLLATMSCAAQNEGILQNCQMDSTGERFTLSAVDTVPNTTAAELYLRAITWISETYKNPDAVIKSRDKEAGVIILNGYTISNSIKSRLELRFKDGKYRWIISDFMCILSDIGLRNRPMEFSPRYTESPNKEIQLKKDCYKYITSLREAMNKKGDEW